MSALNITFRTDATSQIGTGHFMRCLTLAVALESQGAHIRFISRNLPAHLGEMLKAKRMDFVALPNESAGEVGGDLAHSQWLGASQTQDAHATVQALSDRQWDWIVVDHYALDARWESAVRGSTKKILAIDDIADRRHDCDVLLDQNFYSDMHSRYDGKVSAHCVQLLGPRYALLRDEFRQLRAQVKPRSGEVKKILVFFGGVDADNYTGLALDALATLANKAIKIDVVIGTQHPNREQIQQTCDAQGYACHVQTSRMAELMAEADLAIGAGGSATWERCCLGLPAIVFSIAENQEQASRALANQGVVYLGSKEVFATEIERAMRYLFVSTRLHEMSVRAAELVDGQGARRLSDVLFRGVCQ
ncbi:MAG: UDP-2,4-diacetamido-2,4,6-trideoxy-beta-L-altropyranose hydrolase [Gallionella sp.]|nr:UDP-2,4-diacetamido-2,4,6-trideoxy-beta-L-altropyranose hydrolase [Gallionella sp.]